MVTVRAVGDADYDLVAAILERHDPIDVDDHLARVDLPVTPSAGRKLNMAQKLSSRAIN